MSHRVITTKPGLLSRFCELLARVSDTLHLARELKRRGPGGARRLLQERGLMAG